VIILSHDGFNQTPRWQSIIVVPVSTSRSQSRRGPTVVEIQSSIGGLPELSFAVCHQITTLDRAKLTKKMGTVPLDVLKAVEEGVKAALDLE
jgi:mRNA-degrading endonuclease toxin of MazEF toxin-antitoxin module